MKRMFDKAFIYLFMDKYFQCFTLYSAFLDLYLLHVVLVLVHSYAV